VPGDPDFVTTTAHFQPETETFAEMTGPPDNLTTNEDVPVCANSGHRIVVVRTYSSLDPQTSGASDKIRQQINRINWKIMQQSQISSGGDKTLQMKVECSAPGMVNIQQLSIPVGYVGDGVDTTDGDIDLYDAGNWAIKQLGRPERLVSGLVEGRRAVRYLVFHDDGGDMGGGVAVMHGPRHFKSASDDWYDSGSNRTRTDSSWGAVGIFDAIWGKSAALHELLHMMGATYYTAPGSTPTHPDWVSAPFANQTGHCNDGLDVLCYGAQYGYDETRCPASAGYGTPEGVPIDCGYDTYFDAKPEPGEWLDQWWNVGGVENPYLVDHDTQFEADVDGYLQSDLVTLGTDGTAYTYPAFGLITPFGTSFAGSMDSALYDGDGHYVIDVTDVTGEGKADMISLSDNGIVHVYPGQHNRQFGSPVTSLSGVWPVFHTGSGFEPIAVADVTGDGRGDLIICYRTGAGSFVVTLQGNANGQFSSPKVSPIDLDSVISGGEDGYFLDVADVDGDGHADLVGARDTEDGGSVVVYKADASGEFDFSDEQSIDWVMKGGVGNEPVGLGDVNGDGRADLVTWQDGSVYVYGGTSSASFDTSTPSSVTFGGALNSNLLDQTGDELIGVFDESGDGYADLVVARANGSVARYLGGQDYGFDSSPRITWPSGLSSNRFGQEPGHEIVIEKPLWRRAGCTTSGCEWPPSF
jgi:VCBS repeat protein